MAVLKSIEGEGFSLHHSYDKAPRDTDFPPHIHENYELFCLVNGEVDYMVEGNLYSLSGGSVIIMRSGETHKLVVNKSTEYERYVLSFSPSILSKIGISDELLAPFRKRALGEKNMYKESELGLISPILYFEKMLSEAKIVGTQNAVLSSLASLICSINAAFYEKDEPILQKNNIEREIISYINENLSKEIKIEDVAAHVHISASHLCRIFKRATGTSVYNFITAKRLVLYSRNRKKGMGVIEASRKSGFSDYSAFYRLYKKRFGICPQER